MKTFLFAASTLLLSGCLTLGYTRPPPSIHAEKDGLVLDDGVVTFGEKSLATSANMSLHWSKGDSEVMLFLNMAGNSWQAAKYKELWVVADGERTLLPMEHRGSVTSYGTVVESVSATMKVAELQKLANTKSLELRAGLFACSVPPETLALMREYAASVAGTGTPAPQPAAAEQPASANASGAEGANVQADTK